MNSRPRRFDGVIFDLFHTLVDPEDFRPKDFFRWRWAADQTGVDPDALDARMIERAHERLTSPVRVIDQLTEEIRALGGDIDDATATHLDKMAGHYQDLAIAKPRPEILAALRQMRTSEIALAVLSDINEREIRAWRDSPLAKCFAAACFSCELGYSKSSTTAFELASAKLGIPLPRIVFVADGGTDSQELISARRAGVGLVVWMRGFVASNGVHPQERLTASERAADIAIDWPSELTPIVLGIESTDKRRT